MEKCYKDEETEDVDNINAKESNTYPVLEKISDELYKLGNKNLHMEFLASYFRFACENCDTIRAKELFSEYNEKYGCVGNLIGWRDVRRLLRIVCKSDDMELVELLFGSTSLTKNTMYEYILSFNRTDIVKHIISKNIDQLNTREIYNLGEFLSRVGCLSILCDLDGLNKFDKSNYPWFRCIAMKNKRTNVVEWFDSLKV
jgi:hypothetical protein